MKNQLFFKSKFFVYYILTFPHLLAFKFYNLHKIVKANVERWSSILKFKSKTYRTFVYLLVEQREFRNLFYYRIGGVMYILLNITLSKMNTLFIHTPAGKIGKGLFIYHVFATIIAAKEIGKNCWINQQVTIGYTNETDAPVLLNNVRIAAGAKILGNIICEHNSIVGANAVVTKTVPDNCTVVGIPAYIIKETGR